MKIKTEIENLRKQDIYSLMMFVLYRLKDSDEYSTLSQMAYLLDKESLLNLCEYFGGLTITIPTIHELEQIVYALMFFQEVDLKGADFDKVYEELRAKEIDANHIKDTYYTIKEVLKEYKFDVAEANPDV